jgi:hypothetical protein
MRHFKMKHLLILFSFSLFLFTLRVSGQTDKALTYKIEIRQWGLMLVGDVTWEITNKTILIKRQNINGSIDTFSKSLTQNDVQLILTLLKKIDQKNKGESVKNPPDDMGEYDFKISNGEKVSEFHLYQVKIPEVFNLVKQINNFLPEEDQIGYNDEYFRYKKQGI